MKRSGAALWLLVAVLVSSCSGTRAPAAPTVPSTTGVPASTGSTTTTLAPLTFPLTGQPLSDPEAARRPVVTVKIDNSTAARPQAGIDRADLVYEEFTEGITRFVVVFHSQDADVVGPVRSVRPADPAIVTPLGGVLGFSGGSPAAVDVARWSGLALVTEGDTAVMYRRPGRAAPHNLYSSVGGLRSRAPEDGGPPRFAAFLAPGESFSAAGASPVSRLNLVPAPHVTAGYDWDGETRTWKRITDGAPHVLEGGIQVAPTTVIVQYTSYSIFPADSAVQYPEVVGQGEAWIFTAGMLVKGTWSKPTAEMVTSFFDADGRRVVFPPGQTWIHLVEPGSPVEPS